MGDTSNEILDQKTSGLRSILEKRPQRAALSGLFDTYAKEQQR